ncbi:unnamed protein product [Paramecium octaurelia]|uniref:Uncharacterized protein n=1 Tax=Paramecium octaurelia TaxID=43137 RepID=A0A8S1XPX6_PAROT|nr:unnamed protein product [Paramecium octaurelia]
MKFFLTFVFAILALQKPTDPDNNCVFYKCPDEWRTCIANNTCEKHLTQCVTIYQRFQEMPYALGQFYNCLVDDDNTRLLYRCVRQKCNTPISNCLIEAFTKRLT